MKSGTQCSSFAPVSRRRVASWPALPIVAFLLALFLPALSQAGKPQELSDESLQEVSGEGIALALDSFTFRMAPTSYIEMTGSAVVNTASTTDAYDRGWRSGDLRWYGLSFTSNSTATGTDWYSANGGCTPGSDGLGCPMGTGTIKDFASVYNPYLIRVFQYAGYNYQGTCLGNVISNVCSEVSTASPTVYEFIGPSKGDTWRWAFWGQLDVGRVGGVVAAEQGYLQSQTIILGNNFTTDGKSTKLQLLQTPTTVASEQSLSLVYESRLSGNFRFSVGQKTTGVVTTEARNSVPDFNDTEGVYFKNVDAFLPLGALNYQTLVFRSAPALDGNFILELTPIPDLAAVYNSFYCGANTCATSTFTEPGTGAVGAISYSYTQITPLAVSSDKTHGYVYWGSQSGAAPTEGGTTDPGNGIYFRDNAGGYLNVGRAKVEGLLIQSMKLTSLGAAL